MWKVALSGDTLCCGNGLAVGEDTLDTLIAAFHAACPDVVHARALAWPDVLADCSILRAHLCPWEVGVANHPPD